MKGGRFSWKRNVVMKTKRGKYLPLMIVGLMAGSLYAAQTLYVDDDAGDGGDGKSWQTARRFLQDALAEAATSAGPVEVRVAQGIYRPDQGAGLVPGDTEATFALLDNVTLVGGYAGLPALDPNARHISDYPTVLSGDVNGDDGSDFTHALDNCLVVVTSISNDASAVLDGVAVTGGGGPRGSGLSCYGGAPTILDCMFKNNIAVGYNWRSESDEGDGGAIYNLGGRPSFERCHFENNRADSDGGAIWSCDYAGITLLDCTFIGNGARGRGGALGCSLSDIEAAACTFDDNHTESNGGALYIYKGMQSLNQCRFAHNSAAFGGGIYNIVGDLSIARCVFAGNHAEHEGGGLYNDSPARVCVVSVLFAGNRALAMGGGMYNWCDSDPNVINCTFADNRAAQGSGLAAGLPFLKNCIVWDQGAETSPVLQLGDGPAIFYSCVQGGWAGQGNLTDDPCFASPGVWSDINNTPDDPNDDLWIDGDYHLMSRVGRWDPNSGAWVRDRVDSPCIDAGDPNDPAGCEPLPHGDRINLGAYGGRSEASQSYDGAAVYTFQAETSTLLQTGGFAGVHRAYQIQGQFELYVDLGVGAATFAQVKAEAVDLDVPGRTLDPNAVFQMTSLAGTTNPDGSITFVGVATDGSRVDLQCTFVDDAVRLTGQTTPPPNSADFFIFNLDAWARQECVAMAEACRP
jgi:hypothetical protein